MFELKKRFLRLWQALNIGLLLLLSGSAFATGAIPTPPSSDQINSSNDFLDVLFNLIKDKIGPVLVYGSSIYLVYKAIITVVNGVNEAKQTDDWSHMKMAMIHAAAMLTIGIALAYVGYSIFSNMQEGSS